MGIGMELKIRRIRLRVTQAQVGEVLGMSRSWVARVERDDFKDPDAVRKYERALRTFENVSEVA